MCGIISFSGPPDKKLNPDKIKLLFMLNQERGKDSYGYYTPESGVIKEIGKIESCLIQKDFKVPESNLFIGHVRSTSVGFTSKNNAHPFNYGNVVLVMNGTLTNHFDLLREYKFKYMDFDVDSQILAAMINQDQNKTALSKIIGSCAAVYTDTNTGKLYCYRNKERPLFRGNIDGCMYISSIENSLKIIGCSDVKEFKEDNLYEIKDGVIKGTYKVKRAVEPVKAVTAGVQANLFEANGNAHRAFRYIDFDITKSEILIGEWLTPKINIHLTNGGLFFEGYAYKVISSSIYNTWDINVEDNSGKVKTISKFSFKPQVPIITINSHAFATSRVIYKNSNNNFFCEIGDLLKIISVKGTEYECINTTNNYRANVKKSFCRYALEEEIKEYRSMFNVIQSYPDSLEGNINYDYDESQFENSLPDKKDVVVNLLPVVLTKEEIFRSELDSTTTETHEDLAEFTIDSIQQQIDDLTECNNNKTGQSIINLVNILITNYKEKTLMLVNQI